MAGARTMEAIVEVEDEDEDEEETDADWRGSESRRRFSSMKRVISE